MITDSILNRIYKKNLNRENITIEELTSYGLSEEDINILISNNIIKRLDEHIYGLITFEDLYNYGIYLMNKEKFSQAINIFYKCRELNSNYVGIYECLLFIFLRKKHYKKVIEMLDILKEYTSNEIYNIYLYLLCYSIKVDDDKLIKEVKNLKYKDILLIDSSNIKYGNLIVDDLNRILEVIGDIDINDKLSLSEKLVINELIRQSKIKDKKFYNWILKLIKEEKYLEIVDILTKKEMQINLNMYYKSILQMTKKIIKILETNQVSKFTNTSSKNILMAIYNNNLDKAMLENSKYLEKNNIKKEDDAQHILLMKLRELTLLTLNKKEIIKRFQEDKYDIDIQNILMILFNDDIDKALVLIKEYLIKIGKSEYEYLVLNLMNIDIQKKIRMYLETSSILLELGNDEYEYNITFYLQKFYTSLKKNNILNARIYLNIIKTYSKDLDNIIKALEEEFTVIENKHTKYQEEIKLYILDILKDMKENNKLIFILDGISHIDRKMYYRVIDQITELTAFSIEEEPKRIVLRLLDTKIEDKSIVYFEVTDKYKKAYNEKRYNDCIKIIGELLRNREYVGYHAEVYAYMGLSYYHIRNYQEALKYLVIAQDLSKNSKNNRVYSFEYLIDRINMIIKNISNNRVLGENKRFVPFKESEFYNIDDYFGISNIDEIDYCIKEQHMSFRDICKNYELTTEEILLLKLIYARDYYYNSMYLEGDKLLLEVEKTKNKTDRVKKQLIEIRKNKLFYKNRKNILIRKK